MKRALLLLPLVILLTEKTMALEFPPVVSSGMPKTVAETTDYKSTSLYNDVIAFVRAIQRIDPAVRVEWFGRSVDGRDLPLVILGPEGVVDPQSAFAAGMPIVFIMANIHAGEVEGKEASLMLMRDLIGAKARLREEMVILIAPIYNADGNEKISTSHRTTQNGPPGGVGERENSMGLDLNRDFMKLETPEARGLVENILHRWDPLLTVDLHTTNGSYHGYSLTYAPSLSPNAPEELTGFERSTLLPDVRDIMKKQFRQEAYYYGNFVDQLSPQKGWFTYDNRPRFGNNYVGLRNRFVILSEAYSYIDFTKRIEVTYQFVHAILAAVSSHGKKMMRLAAKADERARRGKIKELGVRFEIAPFQENVEILWERSVAATVEDGAPDPETGTGMIKRLGEIVPVRMTDFGIFKPVEKSALPYAYLIDSSLAGVAENLMRHGILVERLEGDAQLVVEEFVVESLQKKEKSFQGHHETTLIGKWKKSKSPQNIPAGTLVVRTHQPLVRLAFYLLEPRSDDGLVNWNFFDEALPVGGVAPVRRVMKETAIPATILRRGGGQ